MERVAAVARVRSEAASIEARVRLSRWSKAWSCRARLSSARPCCGRSGRGAGDPRGREGLYEVRIGLAAQVLDATRGSSSTCCSAIRACRGWTLYDAEFPTRWPRIRRPDYGIRGFVGSAERKPRAYLCRAGSRRACRRRSWGRWRGTRGGGIDFIKDDHGLATRAIAASRSASGPAQVRSAMQATTRAS